MEDLERIMSDENERKIIKRLQHQTLELFNKYMIDSHDRFLLSSILRTISERDVETYKHSVRTALYGVDISDLIYKNSDEKFFRGQLMTYAGLTHDIGKLMIPEEILKSKDFSERDMEKMKEHAELGYFILKEINSDEKGMPISDKWFIMSHIVRRHHAHQKRGYPHSFVEDNVKLSVAQSQFAETMATILAVADSYDAATSRANLKYGKGRALTPEEAKPYLIESHPEQKELIAHLYKLGIFGTLKY